MYSSGRMKIAVIGAGGVGGYFGGRLAAAGYDVTFVVRGQTLAALRAHGLRVESIHGDFTVHPVTATDAPRDPVDVVLIATKAWQLPDVVASIKPLLGPHTVVVPLQNGIDAPEQLAPLGSAHVAGGLCAIVSFVVAPGHIRHTGAEPLVMFGELSNEPSDRLEKLRDAFTAAGVKCEIPRDIQHSMWTKFIFIAPMSGIGAVTRVSVGEWRTTLETRALAERAVLEVMAVARARGVAIEDSALLATMKRYDGLPPASTASLQRDVMEGRPSELEAQIGAVVRLGRAAGVPTPIHEWIYAAVLPAERRARQRVE
jgi:2-dehydropantoate 2-reductase